MWSLPISLVRYSFTFSYNSSHKCRCPAIAGCNGELPDAYAMFKIVSH